MKFHKERERVVKICLELANRGFVAGTGGNVAIRADAEHFVVTPSGVDYYTMTAPDVCVLRLSDKRQVEGELEPSVEANMHAGILSERPECEASVHTHQPIASAYTLLSRPLEVRDHARRLLLGPVVPCVGYAPSGTGMLAMRVVRAFKSKNYACLMRNHGVVCAGKDEAEALTRIADLESECAAFFLECVNEKSSAADPFVQALVVHTLETVLGCTSEEEQ
jgi:L-fuculose-phosphate aldolase